MNVNSKSNQVSATITGVFVYLTMLFTIKQLVFQEAYAGPITNAKNGIKMPTVRKENVALTVFAKKGSTCLSTSSNVSLRERINVATGILFNAMTVTAYPGILSVMAGNIVKMDLMKKGVFQKNVLYLPFNALMETVSVEGHCVMVVAECRDGSDELNCTSTNCDKRSFQCANGQCVSPYSFCNSILDCQDRSDEKAVSCTYGERCPMNSFRCDNKRCRSTAVLCTSTDGCGDNSDETHCKVCCKY
ncbi:Low-density lipoprotein receptor-related protein 4 [Nymphon striatum]|nr:Low-density lipoprotein receptor-related protein 4 [Nymphon striatum]